MNATGRRIRIAVYADVNLNIIDGSAIWLTSLIHVLHLNPRADIDLLLKEAPKREEVTEPLKKLCRVNLLEPHDDHALSVPAAVDRLALEDASRPYDLFVLRGYAVCRTVAGFGQFFNRFWSYITEVPEHPGDLTQETKSELSDIVGASGRLLCQTEELRSLIEAIVPEAADKTTLLPPMVHPDFFTDVDNVPSSRWRLFYAGKFAPLWGTLEMFEQFRRLKRHFPSVELHVAGDKVHQPPDEPDFPAQVRASLRNTSGVVWYGGLPREEIPNIMARCHVALSVRNPQVNTSLELSTKILECAAGGLPVILNRTPMHESMLGADYPFFVNDFGDVLPTVRKALEDTAEWEHAARACRLAADQFSFDNVYEWIRVYLERAAPASPSDRGERQDPVVAVATHDGRFVQEVVNEWEKSGLSVYHDTWKGHSSHDDAVGFEILESADIILCEWCLGNAVWYSNRKRPTQKLIVRFHRQEMETRYPSDVKEHAVDHFVFVSDRVREYAIEEYGWNSGRCLTIPNYVDTHLFARPKLPGSQFNLGLLGYLPKLKRLDLALDILEELRAHDLRFHLYVKGPPPKDIKWLTERPEEVSYFENQFERIENSPLLENAVSFESFGRNVSSWFRKIGFILSTSDIEGSHVAVAEGMSSRAVPVILPWPGAERVYPEEFVHSNVFSAVSRIADLRSQERWISLGSQAKAFIAANCSLDVVLDHWKRLV